jgi:hypothetical protein
MEHGALEHWSLGALEPWSPWMAAAIMMMNLIIASWKRGRDQTRRGSVILARTVEWFRRDGIVEMAWWPF